MRIIRTVTADVPRSVAFDYLSDFTTTTHWDPGTVSTKRLSGDGGVGTRYLNVSSFKKLGDDAERGLRSALMQLGRATDRT